MSTQVPTDLHYVKTHEWVRLDDDGLLTIGITEHAQKLLGDLVFVELPEIETELSAGDEAGVVESVKAASDIYSPVKGEVVEVNDLLADEPGVVNSDPYGDGWIFRLRPDNEEDLHDLMSYEEYEAQIEDEA